MVAPENLLATARQLAEKIAAKSPLTVRQAKAGLIAAATMTEDAGLKYTAGIRCYVQQRRPG